MTASLVKEKMYFINSPIVGISMLNTISQSIFKDGYLTGDTEMLFFLFYFFALRTLLFLISNLFTDL